METLFFNGTMITMEGEHDFAEAVLVTDGTIKAVGPYDEVVKQKNANCQVRDLQGKTLMPGFIDGHGHFTMTLQYTSLADLSEANHFDDVVQILSEFRAKRDLTHGEMIMGYGYDQNFMQEKKHPDKKILDRVSVSNPVIIMHASGHVGAVNSKALELLGYDESTPDLDGGLIDRYPGTREPSGYLEEEAVLKVHTLEGGMSQKGGISGDFQEAQQLYLRNGITTVQDGGASASVIATLRQLADSGQLKVDVVAYPVMMMEGSQVLQENAAYLKHYVNHLKIGGYKIVLDGSPQARTAWMSQPYVAYEGDDPNYCGYPWLSTEEARGYVQKAIADGQQLLCHCNGDAASEEFLKLYEEALAKTDRPAKNQLRPVMIHCQTVRDDQLDRMAALGMIPSIFAAHTWYWGDVHVRNFGPERGSRVSPVKSALDRHLIYNFHTDTPVVKPKLLHSVWAAVNRITRSGVQIGPEQRIGVYDALKGITINAAYSYFEEEKKGSIKVGKQADLVILDRNPLQIDPMEIREIQVLETIKDGETLYQK